MGRVQSFFTENGVGVRDIPNAIVIHELLGLGMLILTWGSFYYVQPKFAPLRTAIERSKLPIVVQARNAYSSVVAKASQSKFLAKLTQDPQQSARLVTSLAESSMLRKLIRPVTIPLKLYATLKIVQFTKGSSHTPTPSSPPPVTSDMKPTPLPINGVYATNTIKKG